MFVLAFSLVSRASYENVLKKVSAVSCVLFRIVFLGFTIYKFGSTGNFDCCVHGV